MNTWITTGETFGNSQQDWLDVQAAKSPGSVIAYF